MWQLDQWHDYVRAVAFFIGLYSFVLLVYRYRNGGGKDWNTKTKDYWYALLMWTAAGCVFTVQGIALNRPFTPGFVFLTAAILVTAKGLHNKGPWGGGHA